PQTSIIFAQLVLRAGQEATDRDVLEDVRRRLRVRYRGELEEEEVERSPVLVAGLPRQPVRHVVLDVPFLALRLAAEPAGLDVRRQRRAEAKSEGDRRIAAREHGLEAIAEEQAIEAEGRRQKRRAELAQDPRLFTTTLEQETRHPEQ